VSGLGSMHPAAPLSLAGAFAFYNLATRILAAHDSSATTLVYSGSLPMNDAPISTLRGIGKVTQGWLEEAGIGTVGNLRRLGAVEVYRRMKFMLPKRVSRNALFGLEAALRGCHWLDLPPEVRAVLQHEAMLIDVALRESVAARRTTD
jgi:DNA transformation protein and related proteins